MSQHVQLTIQLRKTLGNDVRKLRRDGIIPAVIYGKHQEPVHVQVPFSDFNDAYKQAGTTHVIDAALEGKSIPVIVQELDVDPVKSRLRHIDLLAVNLKEEVTATVPVRYINEAPGVKEFGAIVLTHFEEIDVKALPDNIPEVIEVDLSQLVTMSDVIHVSDLSQSDTFTYIEDASLAVANLSVQTQDDEQESAVGADSEEPADSAATEEK